MLFFKLISSFIISVSATPAQSPIEDLLDRAVQNSLSVKSQSYRVKMQEFLGKATTAWSNPNLIAEQVRGVDNTNSPIDKYQMYLMQPLKSPWKSNTQRHIAEADNRIENHHLEDEILRVKVSTLRTIFYYNIAIEKIKKVDAHLKRIDILKKYLQSRKFASGQKQAEAFIVENKIKVLRKQYEDLKIQEQELWLQLDQLLQLKDKKLLKAFWVNQALNVDKETYLQKALSTNHDIELSQFMNEKSAYELQFEKNQKLPDLSLTGGLSRGRNNNPEDNYSLGINISLPLFNMNINKTSAARNALAEVQTKRELLIQEVKKQFISTHQKYEIYKQQIESFPLSNLSSLEKNMQKLTDFFKKGQIDLMTFVEADMTHDQLIDETLNAQVNYVQALSELSVLVGEMLPLQGVIDEISL